jgi:hypothetical protein
MTIFENWEIESPDGTIKISKIQIIQAQSVYDSLDWTAPPLLDYAGTEDGEHSAMAGCIGGAMRITHDETVTLYENNQYFRDLVVSLLQARVLYDRLQMHRNANLS